MKIRKTLLTILQIQRVLLTVFGAFGFSISSGVTASYPVQAAAAQQCNGLSEEECCQLALKKNTIEALEEFLRKYPLGRSNSACSALATTALTAFGTPEEPRDTKSGSPG